MLKKIWSVFIIIMLTVSGCTTNNNDLIDDQLEQLSSEIDNVKEENKSLKNNLANISNDYNSFNVTELKQDIINLEEEVKILRATISGNNERVEWIIKKLPDFEHKIVYINDFSKENNEIQVNEIEWITTTERLKDIGIEYNNLPNGFYIYDEEYQNDKLKFSWDFRCYLLDGAIAKSVSQEMFWDYIESQRYSDLKYPFILYSINDEIIEVYQHYLP